MSNEVKSSPSFVVKVSLLLSLSANIVGGYYAYQYFTSPADAGPLNGSELTQNVDSNPATESQASASPVSVDSGLLAAASNDESNSGTDLTLAQTSHFIDESAPKAEEVEVKEKIVKLIKKEQQQPAPLHASKTNSKGHVDNNYSQSYIIGPPDKELNKDEILADINDRISKPFEVTPSLKKRVSFWFDIYTKYGFADRVIHHSEIPWIVFEVVSIDKEIQSKKGPEWLRITKGEKRVKSRMALIRQTLFSLSKKKNPDQLSSLERALVDALKDVKGSRSQVYEFAARSIRTQTGQKDFYQKGLVSGSEYFEKMEEVFKKKGLPTELTRLPLVESSFNIYATSKVGASGIWQFMPKLGKRFMRVDSLVDERRSPLKATEIAAKLLKENYIILWKQWPLALTAYNHGPGGVRKASLATGTKDLGTIANKYRSKTFSFASSNFYACFLAALYAEKYKEQMFQGLEIRTPLSFKEIRLSKNMTSAEMLRRVGMSKKEMFIYNPDLKDAMDKNAMLPAGFRVILPEELLLAKNIKASRVL